MAKKSNSKKKNSSTEEIKKEEKVVEEVIDKKEDNKQKDKIEDTIKRELENKEENDKKKKELLREEMKKKEERGKVNMHKEKSPFISFLLVVVLLSGLAYFVSVLLNFEGVSDIISAVLVFAFTIIFIGVISTNPSKKKTGSVLAIMTLLIYHVFGILNIFNIINLPTIKRLEDFSNKDLTYTVKWASDNNISLNQVYEYSDLVEEYYIINQSVRAGTKLKDVKGLTVVVSEGPNPYKEVVVPSMLGWDSDRVIKFVEKNYLSNVVVEFVKSDKAVNTVIEQSKSGNIARNEEIKLTFSYGEERGYSEVNLKDLSKKSLFEAEFYLKQNGIKYEIDYDFSDTVKRGYVIKQSIKAGSMVSVDGTNELQKTLVITISKGPKIEVPDLMKMSLEDITNWVIKNKLKISFSDKYDDNSKENDVLEVSHKKGEFIEQGTLIKITLSKGKLKMTKTTDLAAFREWSDKYEVKYEEQYEFSDTVEIGQVIRYSYKSGDTIKNGDTVIVVISNGKKIIVPNVNGMSKNAAKNKLNELGLNVNFVYRYSNSEAGTVIGQSISSGSEVSKGTTITVTLSNGPKPADPTPTPTPTPSCRSAVFYIRQGNTGVQTFNATKAAYPDFKIYANYVDQCSNGDSASGSVCNSGTYDDKHLSSCDNIYLTIVK